MFIFTRWIKIIQGLGHNQVSICIKIATKLFALVTQIAFNLKLNIKAVIIMIYVGMLAALYALSEGSSLSALIAATTACGIFIIGGQGALYALAGMFYPAAIRGTGVGTAVAEGIIHRVIVKPPGLHELRAVIDWL